MTTNPQFKTMKEEIFGPVLTVFVYPSGEYEKYVRVFVADLIIKYTFISWKLQIRLLIML